MGICTNSLKIKSFSKEKLFDILVQIRKRGHMNTGRVDYLWVVARVVMTSAYETMKINPNRTFVWLRDRHKLKIWYHTDRPGGVSLAYACLMVEGRTVCAKQQLFFNQNNVIGSFFEVRVYRKKKSLASARKDFNQVLEPARAQAAGLGLKAQ